MNAKFQKIPCKNSIFFILEKIISKPVEKRVLYSIITARWENSKPK
jgi:hypothetical protein